MLPGASEGLTEVTPEQDLEAVREGAQWAFVGEGRVWVKGEWSDQAGSLEEPRLFSAWDGDLVEGFEQSRDVI